MIKLSIIIPVYNVEKYIEKCILSAINQDLKSNEYEIIVVDDESPDNSVKIINKLMLSYKNISLFSQKNKGLGGARNTGIKNAKGKYILFLDSDDYLVPNSLNEIVEYVINKSLDILEFGAVGVTIQGKKIYLKSQNTYKVLAGYEYLLQNQYMNSACNKLYKTSFLKKYNLLFKENIFIEDFEFNTRVFSYAKKVIGIDKVVSNFVQSPNSITRNRNHKKNLKMINDIYDVIILTLNFKNKNFKKGDIFNKVINERIGFLTATLLYNILKFNINIEVAKSMIYKLRKQKIYPIKNNINDFKKNIFRLCVNNFYCYLALLGIVNFLKK